MKESCSCPMSRPMKRNRSNLYSDWKETKERRKERENQQSPHIGHFEHFEMGQGYIKTASSEAAKMGIRGKGTVVVDCILKDGTVSTFRLRNVLYVPQLDRPLFS